MIRFLFNINGGQPFDRTRIIYGQMMSAFQQMFHRVAHLAVTDDQYA
jgi:hypothetical protein